MQVGYFKLAWADLKQTQNWFGKLMFLALIQFIPIFGTIAVNGYLFGWARDIAWGIRQPLPKRVFGNEDGRLYGRGFYALVITLVFSLIPLAIDIAWMLVSGIGALPFAAMGDSDFIAASMMMLSMAPVVSLLIIAASFIVSILALVGCMRMSIYHSLSAGFQVKKIWAMIRRDMNGMLRIIGMMLLLTFIFTSVLTVIYTIFILVFVFMGAAFIVEWVNGGAAAIPSWGSVWASITVLSIVFTLLMYITMVGGAYIQVMVVRAVGYWTQQFDVPQWRGKDDPMPFEAVPWNAGPPPYMYSVSREACG